MRCKYYKERIEKRKPTEFEERYLLTGYFEPYPFGKGKKGFSFSAIDELLEKIKESTGFPKDDYVLACGHDYPFGKQDLFASSTKEKDWWYLGKVSYFNLSKYLPYYQTTYRLQGNVKVVCRDYNGPLYIVVSTNGSGDYSLLEINGDSQWAWADKNKYRFVRYATQEELDEANKRLEN